MMDKELIIEILEYIENMEEVVESDRFGGRTFEQVVADGDAPDIYHKLKELQAAQERGL